MSILRTVESSIDSPSVKPRDRSPQPVARELVGMLVAVLRELDVGPHPKLGVANAAGPTFRGSVPRHEVSFVQDVPAER